MRSSNKWIRDLIDFELLYLRDDNRDICYLLNNCNITVEWRVLYLYRSYRSSEWSNQMGPTLHQQQQTLFQSPVTWFYKGEKLWPFNGNQTLGSVHRLFAFLGIHRTLKMFEMGIRNHLYTEILLKVKEFKESIDNHLKENENNLNRNWKLMVTFRKENYKLKKKGKMLSAKHLLE